MIRYLLLLLLLTCSVHFGGYGQESQSDVIKTQVEAHSRNYIGHALNQAVLFTGKAHSSVSRYTDGIFLRDRMAKEFDDRGKEKFPAPVPTLESYGEGTLEYDGSLYSGVRMRLDIVRDELVVLAPSMTHGIVLDPLRVGFAEFNGYRVFFVRPGDAHYRLPEGYYVELYSGNHRVIRKEKILFDKIDESFKSWSVKYYILKDGVYTQVKRNNGSVVKTLGSHKKELKDFIRSQRIYMAQDTETAIVRIVAEYERLSQQSGL